MIHLFTKLIENKMEQNHISSIFPWNSNFDTGIPIIDEQHKILVDLLNKLANHLAYGASAPALEAVFKELFDYAAYHFKTEEEIWNRYLSRDDLFAQHLGIHKTFVDDVSQLMQRTQADKQEEEVISFLTHWLAFHILESDKHMAKVVISLQNGASIEEAKKNASEEMSGAMRVLIETILNMYESLSSKTLELMKEIAERQRAEQKLKLAGNVFESTLEAIFITDADGVLVDANPAFCKLLGLDLEQIIGRNMRNNAYGITNVSIDESIWLLATKNGHWAGEIKDTPTNRQTEPAWLTLSTVIDKDALVSNFIGIFSSASQLLDQQHMLEDAINHDLLTGLANRRLLLDRLDQSIIRSKRSHSNFAVCFMDLDGFKQVNDSLGHAIGDELLKLVAKRLEHIVRAGDTVARLGGDEFVVLFNDTEACKDYDVLLRRVISEIESPCTFDQSVCHISVSIGVTVYPNDNSDADMLLQHADAAMYQAKRAGKGQFIYWKT